MFLVLQLRRTLCLRAGLRKLKHLLFMRPPTSLQQQISSISLRIHFLKLKSFQNSRNHFRRSFGKASEHRNQQILRLGLQAFQFNITHNTFQGISLHSPQRHLLSSMTSSMLSSHHHQLIGKRTNSFPHPLQSLGIIVPLLHCSTTFSLSSFQLDNFRKPSGFGLYWILKWHKRVRQKIQNRLLMHFSQCYYPYKGWYHWRYSYCERKKYWKKYQREKLLQGKQHFRRNYLPVFWRVWRHRFRILVEQNRISFYFRARNVFRRLKMKSQRTTRIRVLLIQRTVASEVSQLLSSLKWWRVWSKRRRDFRQLRMVNDLIRNEMKEENKLLDSDQRYILKGLYFKRWHEYHEHRKLRVMEWQGRFEKKVLWICWSYWRFRMTLSTRRNEIEKVNEDLSDTSSDYLTKYRVSSTSPPPTLLHDYDDNSEGEMEQEKSQHLFSLTSIRDHSTPSHVFPLVGTPKGPKLSLQELSESFPRFPRHATPQFTHTNISSPSVPHLLKRTIDTSHALSRGYLTRYERIQRLRSLHYQNR